MTCSNDCQIKIWTISGDLISELPGHEGFVFSVDCISSDFFVSASDDKSVKVWKKNKCSQTIAHPATVWGACVNRRNTDIITACADSAIRVFTLDPTRFIDSESMANYNV